MKSIKIDMINTTPGLARKYLVPSFLLLAICFSTINCSQSNYDGKWTGTTSQGMKFSFAVKGNEVTAITIAYTLSGDCPSTPFGGSLFPFVSISNNSFSTEGKTKVAGKFNSANTASGSFDVNFSGEPSHPCSSTASGTWTATK